MLLRSRRHQDTVDVNADVANIDADAEMKQGREAAVQSALFSSTVRKQFSASTALAKLHEQRFPSRLDDALLVACNGRSTISHGGAF